MTYVTPAGDHISCGQLEAQGRVICPVCDWAVIEDEYIPCSECGEGVCVYCYEADLHVCTAPAQGQE